MNDELIKNEGFEKKSLEKREELTEQSTVQAGPDADPEQYPLRQSTADPRWAIRVVKIWIGFALASLIFILTLLVLGAMYD
jgi:hypothetical protein